MREVVHRPKTQFFTLLSSLWFFVSVGASFPFWGGWPKSFSGMEWFCILVIVLELVFVTAAVVLRFTEPPRITQEQRRILEYCIREGR